MIQAICRHPADDTEILQLTIKKEIKSVKDFLKLNRLTIQQYIASLVSDEQKHCYTSYKFQSKIIITSSLRTYLMFV